MRQRCPRGLRIHHFGCEYSRVNNSQSTVTILCGTDQDSGSGSQKHSSQRTHRSSPPSQRSLSSIIIQQPSNWGKMSRCAPQSNWRKIERIPVPKSSNEKERYHFIFWVFSHISSVIRIEARKGHSDQELTIEDSTYPTHLGSPPNGIMAAQLNAFAKS